MSCNKLQNGASQAQPSGNGEGGLFGWLGSLFSGFQFPTGGFNFPNQNQGNGANIQPINFNSTNKNSFIKPEYALIGIAALALYMFMKK